MAGLGLLNIPYCWLGVVRDGERWRLRLYDQLANRAIEEPLPGPRVQFSYSTDGSTFRPIGGELRLAYQLKTFQGVRHALFAYNEAGRRGDHADFDEFRVDEPLADRTNNIRRAGSSPFTTLPTTCRSGPIRTACCTSRRRIRKRRPGRAPCSASMIAGSVTSRSKP